MKTPPKLDSEAPAQHEGPAAAQSSEPPPPAGVVLPKIYGDDPPREGPFERSSVWTVRGKHEPVRHEVPCDSLRYPELQAVLRVLFAGTAPPAAAPARAGPELLRIEWLEHGTLLAVSKLFTDGTLIRDQGGKTTVERHLSREGLDALALAIEHAQLHSPGKRWCAPEE